MKSCIRNKIRPNRYSLKFLGVIFFMILLIGCWQDDDYNPKSLNYNNVESKIASLQSKIRRLEVRHEELKTENVNLLAEVNNLRKSKKDLIQEIEEKKIEIESLKQSNQWRTIGIVLIGVVVFGFPLCVIGGMFFKKSPKNNEKSGFKECPKCHWELEQDSKVCPNPECRTRFQ